ncbi:hypothetical protein [Actinoalloteichus hymeniacidonis]|uniref:Uncharacterized protein n=1 Tax=Actinoalloteichus hymeniacidonis TaxID=340345 RepID=A0AAC9MWL8_9PSEU|nr:hypothetical protein [Actinoalloteichus hymeniacidonis]AOS61156.1 hypothetical protein TL08_01585 [Actinoalloteichus hymeniacidonis]MBB5910843.1 hypothetical protein [Actinoalloteichus hymeniacidonis]
MHESNRFSPTFRGGQLASRVEAQDTVCMILLVEAIGGLIDEIPARQLTEAGLVIFEKLEDIEISWPNGRALISVKDKAVSYSDITNEIEKFSKLYSNTSDNNGMVFRLEAGSLSGSKARTLIDDLRALKSVAQSGVISEWRMAAQDFEAEHQAPSSIAAITTVCIRDMNINLDVGKAIFASRFRTVFPVQQFTDDKIFENYSRMIYEQIAPARRTRATIRIDILKKSLLEPLVPRMLHGINTDVMKTRYGYVVDPTLSEKIDLSLKIIQASKRKALKRWRRHARKHAVASLLYRGHVACPFCNHPLMFSTFGDNSVGCPNCHYIPYLTIFYACDCTEPVALVRQPSVETIETFSEILEEVKINSPTCDKCGQRVDREKLYSRVFSATIPWPPESYNENELITIRTKIGWEGRSYKIPGETPLSLIKKGEWKESAE